MRTVNSDVASRLRGLAGACVLLIALCAFATAANAGGNNTMSPMGSVIEIVTFKLKEGVTHEAFEPIDKAVQDEHVSRQPGFVSRQSATGAAGEWLVIVHWKSVAQAEASMSTFMDAPAAGTFMDHVNASTMVMKRYSPAR